MSSDKAEVSSLEAIAEVRRDPQRDTIIFAKSDRLDQGLAGSGVYYTLRAQHNYEEMALFFFDEYRHDLRLIDPRNEMVSAGVVEDSLGYRHIRFNQVYKNLHVVDCQLLVQFDSAGRLDLLQGRYAATPRLTNLSPTVSEVEATHIVASTLGASTTINSSRLAIFVGPSGEAQLAHVIEVNRGQPNGFRLILDALTGQELQKTPTSYTNRDSPL